jgi:hypothetical protein
MFELEERCFDAKAAGYCFNLHNSGYDAAYIYG